MPEKLVSERKRQRQGFRNIENHKFTSVNVCFQYENNAVFGVSFRRLFKISSGIPAGNR